MSKYEILDLVADSYNPSILLIALVLSLRVLREKEILRALQNVGMLLITIVPVYALILIDKKAELWLSMGLDYSTHTALAAVITIYIAKETKYALQIIASTALYIGLMLYQEYHTLMDIVSTLVVIVPITMMINKFVK